jgi:hypothetical protein
VAAGYDEIPMSLVRRVAVEVAAPLADIFNCSFATGVVPAALKKSVVIPKFKKGDRKNPKNYRPISNLPTFSKPLENCFLIRLASFFRQCRVIPSNQHGFLQGKSTMTALFEFFKSLYAALEDGQRVMAMCYDLTNAFGTVSHAVLLSKLERAGVRGVPLQWVASYLDNRRQVVSIKHTEGRNVRVVYSSEVEVACGTPQGAILSPLLFDAGVLDMPLMVVLCILTQYADDSTALVASGTVASLVREAQSMARYCADNFLTMNASKSVLLQFKPSSATNESSPYIQIDGKSIAKVKSTKLLGLYVCDTLGWREHGEQVVGSLESAVFLINSLRGTVSLAQLRNVYYAYAFSKIQYGIIFWGGSDRVLNDVFVAQKKVIRAMCGVRYWRGPKKLDSARPLFESLNVLPVYSVYLLECCKFVHKFQRLYFPRVKDVHPHSTRRGEDLYIPNQSSAFVRKNNPYTILAELYMKLPVSFRCETDYSRFKNALKSLVFKKKFYCADEFHSYLDNLYREL